MTRSLGAVLVYIKMKRGKRERRGEREREKAKETERSFLFCKEDLIMKFTDSSQIPYY
jgi:hypothetical protein